LIHEIEIQLKPGENLAQCSARIVEQQAITSDIFKMTLKAPEIVRLARPGQFVHARLRDSIDPLLRRPFSIHRIQSKSNELELLYRVVGQGTALMSSIQAGQSLDLMGPLGNGFDLDCEVDHALIVAGGMGGAPVFFLMDELLKLNKKITLLWGAREGREIFHEQELGACGIDVRLATEDGSKGCEGLVTNLLCNFLKESHDRQKLTGFVCGPECMIHAVQEHAESTLFPWQASLEERMACGVGVCLGCGIRLKNVEAYKMVCKDGPVFDLREVAFDG
jgi:dihydroorotate dehydrogenase electron transfer subunit